MPTATFDRRYFDRLMKFKITDKTLEDQCGKMGMSLESISKDEIVVESSPNRPDLLDCVGFARALKNFMHKSKKLTYSLAASKPYLEIGIGKEVGRVRPFISAFVALNVKLDDSSLANLINFSEKFCEGYGRKRRKIAMGMHDLDKVKGSVSYNAYGDESFVPLNEKKESRFSEIIKKNQKGREYGYTIRSGENGYPALKDDDGILSLIPIINSERTRVTTSTRNILVDITGMSQYLINKCADMFAATFMDIGADVRPVMLRQMGKGYMQPGLKKRFIEIELARAEKEIGVRIGFNNIISLANKMGYEAALVGKKIRFGVPEYRMDVIDEQDVVEDIAIAYGYDYIPATSLSSAQQGELNNMSRLSEHFSELMLGLGFDEMVNSYLTNDDTNFSRMRTERNADYCIRLKNPRSDNITIMRTWLLPGLMKNLGMSQHDKMPHNVFELDLAFAVKAESALERYHLAAISSHSRANFNDMKAIVQSISDAMGLGVKFSKYSHSSFIEGRCAKITIAGKEMGFFGELHPETLYNFNIEEPAVAFEMELPFI
ncbi:MAG: phenylalanine--tRNA ligase subunit beta [Candidatus Micrarchaeota archaeon]|nr:phenylalanine--tRNA ligase subunit beta [Candidatus Micrarchaeota archaeon]MDE1823770.1 phenylalanine--tRNA ligase subunit beta [Candidatus Micrarchaeota archaeon]